MTKTTRILYFIVGVIFPIFVGLLHSYAHFSDLLTPEVQEHLSKELMIMGKPQIYWNAWGLMSFMMGLSFIVIGLLNLTIYRRLRPGEQPPVGALLAMLVYLISVLYAANQFEAAEQFYGGIAGLIMVGVCLFSILKSPSTS